MKIKLIILFFIHVFSFGFIYAQSINNIFYLSNNEEEISFPENFLYKAIEIIKNIKLFEYEINSISGLNVDYLFKGDLIENRNLEIIVRRRNESKEAIKIYKIHDIIFENNPLYLFYFQFELFKSDKDIKNFIYDIYNFKIDEKGNIEERMIIENEIDKTVLLEKEEYKFIEGKFINYRNYAVNSNPTSFIIKSFIIKPDSSLQWLKTKESLNRIFNEKGLIESESIRETSYSYKDEPYHYDIYNVSFHKNADIKNFDVIYKESDLKKSNMLSHFNYMLLKDSKNSSKLIREYQIKEDKKIFLKGQIETNNFSDSNDLVIIKNTVFNIKPSLTGLYENERNNISTYYEFIHLNNTQKISKKRIIKTNYLEDLTQMLISLIDIEFGYDYQNNLNKIIIKYSGIKNKEKQNSIIDVQKEVEIDFLEKMESGEPSKIKLKMSSNIGEDPYISEEIIEHDCHYIISEALNGKLFFDDNIDNLKDSHLRIKNITESGELEFLT